MSSKSRSTLLENECVCVCVFSICCWKSESVVLVIYEIIHMLVLKFHIGSTISLTYFYFPMFNIASLEGVGYILLLLVI